MWIMIAGPYRTGTTSEAERASNLLALNRAAYEVWRKGHVPVVGVNLALPVIEAVEADVYDAVMMRLSAALATRCDAILRIGGPSVGADQEVEVVRANGGTVYRDIGDVPNA